MSSCELVYDGQLAIGECADIGKRIMLATDITGSLAELIERAAQLATSTLSNALDDAGSHGHVLNTIKAVSPGMRFTGPAVTVREITGEVSTFASADFRVGAIIDAARAGDVVVIDMGGAKCSTWGGMASLAAKVKGVAGLLVDGGVRDLEEMIEFGFPVFARHHGADDRAHPPESRGDQRTGISRRRRCGAGRPDCRGRHGRRLFAESRGGASGVAGRRNAPR